MHELARLLLFFVAFIVRAAADPAPLVVSRAAMPVVTRVSMVEKKAEPTRREQPKSVRPRKTKQRCRWSSL